MKKTGIALSLILILSTFAGAVQATGAASAGNQSWSSVGYDSANTGYNPNSGDIDTSLVKENWNTSTGGVVAGGGAVVNGVLYVGSGDDKLYAIEADTGKIKWTFTAGNDISSSPAVKNGVVYFGSFDDKLYAVNADNGNKKWSFKTGGDVVSSPAVKNGVVYVGSNDNKLYAVNADNGNEKWNFTTGGEVRSSPAVKNGVVYVGSKDNKLYAVNADNGNEKWNYSTGDSITASPAVKNGIVYVGSFDTKLHAVNASTGDGEWTKETGSYILSRATVANGMVYVGPASDKVHAFDASTGDKKWTQTVDAYKFFGLQTAATSGTVYVGTDSDKVYGLDASTGQITWKHTVGGDIVGPLAVTNKTLYFGLNNGDVYSLVERKKPLSEFSYSPTEPKEEEPVEFDGSKSVDPNGKISSYKWDFDSDGTFEKSGEKGSYTFKNSGEYKITLKVTDEEGKTDTTTKTVSVSEKNTGDGPTASFSYEPKDPQIGEDISFDGSSSSDSDGEITSYKWDFDSDGTFEKSGEKGSYTFSSPGEYKVTLRVTDDDGQTDTVKKTISVTENKKPTASFKTYPDKPSEKQDVRFIPANSKDPDGEITSYKWDFDSDGTFEKSGEGVTYAFKKPGSYDVTLKVTDNGGRTNTTTKTISVTDNKKPTASFKIYNKTPNEGESVQFRAVGSNDPDGKISSHKWDFDGDGTFEKSGFLVTYTYENQGVYDVTVKVTDDSGESDTETKEVKVSKKDPQEGKIDFVKLDVTPEEVKTGEKVETEVKIKNPGETKASYNLSLKVDGEVRKYKKGTLEGGSSKTVNFSLTFDSAGTYKIGVNDYATKTVKVKSGGDGGKPDIAFPDKGETAEVGEKVKLEFKLKNNGSKMKNVELDVGIPDSWKIVGHTDAGAEFDNGSWKWDKVTSKKQVGVTVKIPLDANESGKRKLPTEVMSGGKMVVSDEFKFNVEKLTIPEAIAGDNAKIEFDEIQKAITKWTSGEVVPGTGEKIKFNQLQEIIRLWASGEKVDE